MAVLPIAVLPVTVLPIAVLKDAFAPQNKQVWVKIWLIFNIWLKYNQMLTICQYGAKQHIICPYKVVRLDSLRNSSRPLPKPCAERCAGYE